MKSTVRRFIYGLSVLTSAMGMGFAFSAHGATLIYSNDVLGEVEPCGCRTNPTGGMARKANFLETLKAKPETGEFLQLDAGDLLFPTDTIPDALVKQSELQ